jgi:hypothetical protein
MKKIYLLVVFVLSTFLLKAQRFFYVETNDITEGFLLEGLLKGSQFVVETPLASDYIIKTDAGFEKGSHILNLKMTVQDSLTFSTVFQTREEYTIGELHANARLILRLAVKTFIDKNMDRIILCARDDHYDSRMKYLKPKKDKT